MNIENIACQSAPQPAPLQQGQLIWKGACSSGKYKKERLTVNLVAWRFPNSSGTGPAHHLEKCQLILKIVKEKINETA